MTSSRADNHDLDKLARWHKDLLAGSKGGFPAYAMFLVSAEDRIAHDVFRAFRTSFQARGAGFERLVIFGQHGLSTTVRGLLDQFGLSLQAIPVLALFASPEENQVHHLPLPRGSALHPPQGETATGAINAGVGLWREVLGNLEARAGQDDNLDLASLHQQLSHHRGDGTLVDAVGQVLDRIS